jgi:hypothetical protein
MTVLNDTVYPDSFNYFKPSLPVVINGRSDPTSQHSHDICTPFNITMPKTPPFSLKNIALGQVNGFAYLYSITDAFIQFQTATVPPRVLSSAHSCTNTTR